MVARSVNKEMSAIPSNNLHAHHNAATDVELLPSQPKEMNQSTAKRQESPAALPNEWNILFSESRVSSEDMFLKASSGNAIQSGVFGSDSKDNWAPEVCVMITGDSTNSITDNKLQPHFSIPPLGPNKLAIPFAIMENLWAESSKDAS